MNKEIVDLSKEMAKFNESMGTEKLIDYLATSLIRITQEINKGNIAVTFDKNVKVIVDIEGVHSLEKANI